MAKYITKRLLFLIPVLIGVSLIVFTLLYITPGDPARMILGEQAEQQQVDQLREEMGLNDSFIVQYGRYVKNIVLHGDFGTSYATKSQVIEEIMAVFPNTLKLALTSVALAIVIGITFGVVSAVKQYSIFDSAISVIAILGISMPMFWLGLLMILLFSVKLGWLPASGYNSWKHMLMPAVCLGAQSIAVITRMTRSSMLEIVRQDYIRTVRAKGQKEIVVIVKHAFRNALVPIVTTVGLQFGHLLGGAMLTETVFSIPGLGRLMVESIKTRDFPMVQGSVLFIAVAFTLVNLIVDLLYAYVDPRISKS